MYLGMGCSPHSQYPQDGGEEVGLLVHEIFGRKRVLAELVVVFTKGGRQLILGIFPGVHRTAQKV